MLQGTPLYASPPLYAAAENGHTAVVEILVKAGADVNKVHVSHWMWESDILLLLLF